MNAQFASLEPPPAEVQTVMAALQDLPEDTNQFLGTITGAVRPGEFYAPSNVERILRAGVAAGAAASY